MRNGQKIHNCPAACTTRGEDVFSKSNHWHNQESRHTPETLQLNQKLKANVKKRARDHTKTPIPEVLAQELAKLCKKILILNQQE